MFIVQSSNSDYEHSRRPRSRVSTLAARVDTAMQYPYSEHQLHNPNNKEVTRMLDTRDSPTPSAALLKVLDGAVDLHVHSGPSPFPRRLNHVEASYDARPDRHARHPHQVAPPQHGDGSARDGGPADGRADARVRRRRAQLRGRRHQPVGGRRRDPDGRPRVWGPTVSAAQHIAAHSHDDGFPTRRLEPRGEGGVDLRRRTATSPPRPCASPSSSPRPASCSPAATSTASR